jgi:hypothetical protein
MPMPRVSWLTPYDISIRRRKYSRYARAALFTVTALLFCAHVPARRLPHHYRPAADMTAGG